MNRRLDNVVDEAKPSSVVASSNAPEITIVLPTYKEAGNVAAMVEKLDRALAGRRWEVIFVDDDSPDGTAETARAIAAEDPRVHCILRIGRRGRASACFEGMLAAQAPYVAVMDADLQHDEAILPQMLDRLKAGEADMVIGTRYVEGGGAAGLKGKRVTVSRTARDIARFLLRLELSDPASGFFAMRRDIAGQVARNGVADGFSTTLDIATSRNLKLRIAEIPYHFRAREHGESKLSIRQVAEFLALVGSRVTGGLLPPRFILFCVIGGLGVVVHLAVLAAAISADMVFALAQTLATAVAVVNNFVLNNSLTFGDRSLGGWAKWRGLAVYGVICSFGALSNVSIASWLYEFDNVWWLAGIAGAAVSAVWNYAASRTFVWSR
jgi:dolichol-phosphate mannosyltransferase